MSNYHDQRTTDLTKVKRDVRRRRMFVTINDR